MDIILKIWAEVNNKGIFLVKIIKCLCICEMETLLWIMVNAVNDKDDEEDKIFLLCFWVYYKHYVRWNESAV